MRSLITFVMAGGKGERLYPLTRDRAKPGVPFGGIYRIIDFSLSNCINSGIRRIHVLTQYKSFSLDRHLRMGWNIFHGELGEYIDVVPAQQRVGDHWYQGTADSIFQNIYSIERERPDRVLILSGDHVYSMDYHQMLSFHEEQRADVTIAVVQRPAGESAQFGLVAVDDRWSVTGFEEKPDRPHLTVPGRPDRILVSMGVYVFNCDVLEEELTRDAENVQSHHDFGKNVLPSLIGRRRIAAFHFWDEARGRPCYWRDIGTIDAYYEANIDLVNVVPELNLYDQRWPVRTYHEQVPPAKTVFAEEDKGRIGQLLDSLVSGGCIISGGRVQRSVLSPFVRVNSYADVADAVILEHVDIGRHAKIRRAIIDKGVTVPEGTEIGLNPGADQERFHVTSSGIVVVPKGTFIATPAAVV